MKTETLFKIGLLAVSLLFLSCSGCKKDPVIEKIINEPTVKIISVDNISETSADVVARVINNGGSFIKETGIRLAGRNIIATSLESNFVVSLSGLEPGSPYIVEAYARNEQKTGYSSSFEFVTKRQEPKSFSIKEAHLNTVASDQAGSIYVAGYLLSSVNDIFIAKFDAQANLLWLKKIEGANGKNIDNILIYKNTIYAQVTRNSQPSLGNWGTLAVDAYHAENGDLIWSTEIRDNVSGADFLVVSEDGYIYSGGGTEIHKLSLLGQKLAEHKLTGSQGFKYLAFIDNKVLATGGRLQQGKDQAMIWVMDKDLNLLWHLASQDLKTRQATLGIVTFPEKNLVFISQFNGDEFMGPLTYSLLCYEYNGNNMELKWQKYISEARDLYLKKEADNFYAYAQSQSEDNQLFANPILFDISGNIVWQAEGFNPGKLAISGDSLYVAQGQEKIKIIKK